ncbi:MAG: class I SAM-dependent methyltransferase, partial [Pseudomonadota bacterium]|nr:class I SAM-dependent methyltransferase [Pseudomonadota bacterium]
MNQPVDFFKTPTCSKPQTRPSPLFLWGQPPLLLRLLSKIQVGELHLILPDGQHQVYRGQHLGQQAVLQLHDLRACDAIMQRADIGFAESYREGWLDSPDLLALLELALANEALLTDAFLGKWYGKLWYRFKHWQNRNTKTNSQKNIHAHYDLGNDFYQLWLDRSMTYSAALFSAPDQSLESAQIAKYARLFEQLQLQSGDHVLEIGCGWGGFAEYAARRGVRVTGVSLSREQLKYANQR